jgi:hypothetical protein
MSACACVRVCLCLYASACMWLPVLLVCVRGYSGKGSWSSDWVGGREEGRDGGRAVSSQFGHPLNFKFANPEPQSLKMNIY